MQRDRFLLRVLTGLTLTACLSSLTGSLKAQRWQWVAVPASAADESGAVVAVDNEGRAALAGLFRPGFAPAGATLAEAGGEDVYVAAFDAGGNVRWAVSGGSVLDDEVAALTTGPDGGVTCAGSYWSRGFFGDTIIEASPNIKGIFLVNYSAEGRQRWLRAINGTQLKQVGDLATDPAGNIYLAGYFSDQLLVEDVVLRAEGRSDLFLLKFDASGRLIWAVRDGSTGDARGVTLAVTPGEEIVVGGYFNDTLRVAGQTLTANTFDRDVFLIRYDREGRPLWARKAGGVHDDEITAVAIDEQGDIYATGFLVGVMTLSESISIQSRTGNADFYLLRYRADGEPLVGRAMGGLLSQQATGLAIAGGEIVIGGFYRGEMTIDGQTVSAGAGFGSFVAAFDDQARLRWLKNIPSNDGIYVADLAGGAGGGLYVGGAFQGTTAFDDRIVTATGGFDPFLARLEPAATSTPARPPATAGWRFFPNPAADAIVLESVAADYAIALFQADGRLLGYWRQPRRIDLHALPPGRYTLLYIDGQNREAAPLLIIR